MRALIPVGVVFGMAACSNPRPPTSNVAATSAGIQQQTSAVVLDVGPGVTPPQVIRQVSPPTPEDLRGKPIEQRITIIEAVIDETGAVRDPRLVRSSYPSLDQAAINAVKTWTYRPAQKDGRNVAVRVTITVTPEVR